MQSTSLIVSLVSQPLFRYDDIHTASQYCSALALSRPGCKCGHWILGLTGKTPPLTSQQQCRGRGFIHAGRHAWPRGLESSAFFGHVCSRGFSLVVEQMVGSAKLRASDEKVKETRAKKGAFMKWHKGIRTVPG